MLQDDEQRARLRLIRTETVGPVTYRQLLARFGSARHALERLPDLARRGGASRFTLASLQAVEAEFAAGLKLGGRWLFVDTAEYPGLLAQIDDAPPVLLALGRLSLLQVQAVAMVGARNASAAGLRLAGTIARDLAAQGCTVVSGLARGIDTAAHKGALAAPAGGTIGVVAGGADVVYPPENHALQAAIAEQGVVLSEQPLGAQPQARHFPRRNRIVSGVSLGVVVVEATPKSGSLITARLAGEQGRQVMAVPGSPLEPRAQGCNDLIRTGATLVTSAADVLECLAPLAGPYAAPPLTVAEACDDGEPDDAARAAVLALLSVTPVPIDDLVRWSHVPPGQVAFALLELELAGRLVRHAGNRVSLVAPAL